MSENGKKFGPIVFIAIAAGLVLGSIFVYLHRGGADVQVRPRAVESQLTEIDLVNAGKGGGAADMVVVASWQSGKLVAAEGLAGYEESHTGDQTVTFKLADSAKAQWLKSGETVAIGWVRLSDDSSVKVEIQH